MASAAKTSARGPLRRLLRHSRAHRKQVIAASVASVLNKLFDLAPPALIGLAVDTVVEGPGSVLAQLGIESPGAQLGWLAVLTVLIWMLESAFEYLQKWLWRNLAQTIQHELRVEAFSHLQTLDTSWFQEARTGRLLAILNDDVNQLERFLDGGADDLLQTATTMVLVSAAFFWLSPVVALLALLPVPVILWGSFTFQRHIGPRYAAVREAASQVSGQLANTLGGIETVKAFTAEEHEVQRIEALSETYRQANRRAIALSSAFSPMIRMAIVVGFTATLVIGGQQALAGTLEVGAYSVLVFLTQRLLWPLTRLGQTFDLFQRAMASTTRILDLVDTRPAIVSGPTRLARQAIRGHVRFDGVTFGYPGRDPLLRDFHLEIPAGSTLAVVGPTGAGKSTLIRLLLRLHDPLDGKVTIDGQDVRGLDLRDLRAAIGLVSQHVFLFPGSVRDNVRYGTFDADDDALLAALASAEAMGFVDELPHGLDTLIGERGQKLSGGQAQRLSLARAILKDPPILVLDEATSAVDNETEAAIQRSLARVAVGRTTIVIAHRLSTVRHADRIVVLDEGRIVESGTHEDLVSAGGLYARLWAVQTGEGGALAG